MAQEENERLDLFTRLEQVIGPSAARTLMERLPPMPWNDLATKQDVLLVKQDLLLVKQDLLLVKQDLQQDVLLVKEDLAEAKQELRAAIVDMGMGVRAELRAEIQAAKHETIAAFRGELNGAITTQTRAIVSQTRTMIVTMIATVITVVGFVHMVAPPGTTVP